MPSGVGELAFLGNPLEGFGGALDPILEIVAIRRQKADHLIGSAGGGPGYVACGEIDSLSNAVLVLQRLAPSRITRIWGRRPASLRPADAIAWRTLELPENPARSEAEILMFISDVEREPVVTEASASTPPQVFLSTKAENNVLRTLP